MILKYSTICFPHQQNCVDIQMQNNFHAAFAIAVFFYVCTAFLKKHHAQYE